MSFAMLRRVSLSGCATIASVLALSAALFAQQAPAPVAPQYDVTFDVNAAVYSGSTTFAVDKDGKVTGTMKLVTPAVVDAKLNGEIKAGVWTFNYPFTMDNQGQVCSGTVSGSARVTTDNTEATGTVAIGGDCAPEALSGTFSFKKKAK